MAEWLTLIAGATVLLGAIACFHALRGKPLGDAPACAACGYDLSSYIPDTCPECAASLRSETIQVSRRRRSPARVFVGLFVCALGACFFYAVAASPMARHAALDAALDRQGEFPTNQHATAAASKAFVGGELAGTQTARFMRNAAPRFTVDLRTEGAERWMLNIAQTTEQAIPGRRWSGLDCDVQAEVLIDDQPAGPRIVLDFSGPRSSLYGPFCGGLITHGGGWMHLALDGKQPPFGSTVTLRLHVTVSDARTVPSPAAPITVTSDHKVVIPAAFPTAFAE